MAFVRFRIPRGILFSAAAVALAIPLIAAPPSTADDLVGTSDLRQVSTHDLFGRSADISASVQPDTRMFSVNPLLPQASLIWAAREPTRRNPAIRYGTVFELDRSFDRLVTDPAGRFAAFITVGERGMQLRDMSPSGNNRPPADLATQGETVAIDITPDGTTVVVASQRDGTAYLDVYDTQARERISSFSRQVRGRVSDMVVSANGYQAYFVTPESYRGPTLWRMQLRTGVARSTILPDWFDRQLSITATADGGVVAIGSPTRHQVAIVETGTWRLSTVQDLRGQPGPLGTLVEAVPLTGAILASGQSPGLTLLDPEDGYRSRGASTIGLDFPPLVLTTNGQGTQAYALGSPEGEELGRRIAFIDTGLEPDPRIRAQARTVGTSVKVTGTVRDIAPGTRLLVEWKVRGSGETWTRILPKPIVRPDGTFRWKGTMGQGRLVIEVSAEGAQDRARTRVN